MKSGMRLVMIIAITLTIRGLGLAGRGDKIGTAAGYELLLPVGGKSIAVSGAGLASVRGAEAIFWNPAGLSWDENRTSTLFSHMSFIAGLSVEYVGIGTNIGDVISLGASAKSVSYGDIPVTTEDFPDGTGEIARPSFLIFGFSASRKLTDHIAFGITGNYFTQHFPSASATGIAVTGGLQYRGLGGLDDMSLAVVVRNIGSSFQFEGDGLTRTGRVDDVTRDQSIIKLDGATNELPTAIEIGLQYLFTLRDDLKLSLLTAYQNNDFSHDEYRVGTEVEVNGSMWLRGGWTVPSEDEEDSYIFGPTLGAGFRHEIKGISVEVDYAFRPVRYFDANHIISLTLGL